MHSLSVKCMSTCHLRWTSLGDVLVSKRCLYGTRDASQRWEAFLASELLRHGFVQGKSSPCVFVHSSKDLRCVVHGDDFVFSGTDDALDWVTECMHKSFLIKVVGRLGGDAGDLKEIRVLNRVLRWLPGGVSYEADPRHVEMLILDFPPTSGVVKTAGLKNSQDLEADIPLEGTEIRRFRGGAARANYLAQDRADICYATKELGRRMHAPCKRDIVALERLVKYLASEPRLVLEYELQAAGNLQVYCDTDFAGCQVTRKSTSGGGAMFGIHLVKHWSSTQRS